MHVSMYTAYGIFPIISHMY